MVLSEVLGVARSERGADIEGGGELDGTGEGECEPLAVELPRALIVAADAALDVPVPDAHALGDATTVAVAVDAADTLRPMLAAGDFDTDAPPSDSARHSAETASRALPAAHAGRATRGAHASSADVADAFGAHHNDAPPTATSGARTAAVDRSADPGACTTSAVSPAHVAGPDAAHDMDAALHVPPTQPGTDTKRGLGDAVSALVAERVCTQGKRMK
jgi:hypothetical protein